jgi:hypothetical protein
MVEQMVNGTERLRLLTWMAGAADADKSQIDARTRRIFIGDLHAYLGDVEEASPTLKRAAADFSVLTPAMKSAQKVLAAVADGAAVDFPAGPPRPRVRLDCGVKDAPPRVFYDIHAPLAETVLMLALEDVRTIEAVGRIRRCKDTKGCDEPGGRIFLQGRTDQEYCSRKCAVRVAVRAQKSRASKRRASTKGAAA